MLSECSCNYLKFKEEIENDILVLLSGPEPQRTLIENKVLEALKNYDKKVLFIRGTLNNNLKLEVSKNIKVIDYLLSSELEKVIPQKIRDTLFFQTCRTSRKHTLLYPP